MRFLRLRRGALLSAENASSKEGNWHRPWDTHTERRLESTRHATLPHTRIWKTRASYLLSLCRTTRLAAMISFIIPAHNEELWLGKCLGSIRTAMATLAEPYEVIVVDDASTDATHQIAEQMGTRTIRVEHRKISAVRNSGAHAALGEMFIFVDADTQVNQHAVRAAFLALRSGAAGGACVFEFDGVVPLWGRIIHRFGVTMGRLLRLAGGCFLFCTREAYAAIGGFSEDFRAGEDLAFVLALKKVGRFVVPKPTVVTSGRKLSVVGPWEVVMLLVRIALRGPRYESEKTLDFLYGRRAQECRRPVQTDKTA
jgi:glycosyltransferase involved in cell wall biosynthesis